MATVRSQTALVRVLNASTFMVHRLHAGRRADGRSGRHPARVRRASERAPILNIMKTGPSRAALFALTLLAAAGLSACTSDKPAVCSSVDELQTSVDNLKDIQLGENGLSAASEHPRAGQDERRAGQDRREAAVRDRDRSGHHGCLVAGNLGDGRKG